MLLPQLAGVAVEQIEGSTAELRIWARPKVERAPCPGCGGRSVRVHRRYRRRLADLAVGGRQVILVLRVRVFVCQDQSCPVRRFAEQAESQTVPHARRSGGLREVLEQIGLALAGRAGARLAARFALPISRNTVLRLAAGCRTGRRRWFGSSESSTSRSAGSTSTAQCSSTWTPTGRSTCCPTGRPEPSPSGCRRIRGLR